MSRLTGKTAVVTGGGSGIGFGAAKRFIDEGAFVYIFGRRQATLDAALAKLGPNAKGVSGSVTDPADLDRLYDAVRSERGGLDILFANAGVASFASLDQITPEHYDHQFDVNVKGLVFTVQKAVPLMTAGSSIILTGSTTGVKGTPALSIYSATKAAVRNLARSWALDLKGAGIRVNVLSPGPTTTDGLLDVVGQDGLDALSAATPMNRIGDPAETAAVAAFLASSDSSFMTGGEVFVDGGVAQV